MSKHKLNPSLWVQNYSDFMFNYTITRVNDRDIAKDLIQDTFVAALKSMKNYKGEATERTWLTAILKRKIIDHYRNKNSKKGQTEIKIPNLSQSNDWLENKIADPFTINAENAIENKELGEAIYNCLSKLPPKQATVFKLKTINQVDTQTICKDLNITASNFWVIIHRARTAMANCLEKNWF